MDTLKASTGKGLSQHNAKVTSSSSPIRDTLCGWWGRRTTLPVGLLGQKGRFLQTGCHPMYRLRILTMGMKGDAELDLERGWEGAGTEEHTTHREGQSFTNTMPSGGRGGNRNTGG